ncbi:MAG: peptidyl-prolyl cis-trans isomerase D, partial [Alteromonadaceae bacterium]
NILPFNNPQVIDAIFSDLVLNDNVNSDVIEVNDNLAIVVRLSEYQAAQVKPLAEVSEQIETALIAEKSTSKALVTAEQLLSEFKAGNDISQALIAVKSSFVAKVALARFGGDIDQSIIKEAFVLPHPSEGNISASTVTLSNGDLALLELQNVIEGSAVIDIDDNITKKQVTQLAQSAYNSYVASLKVNAQISRREVSEVTTTY